LYLPAYEDGTDSVPKRRHIKFKCGGITQKKTYIIILLKHVIYNMGKVWNAEQSLL
jgi:hypothetical protein